jgi:hypothetical protein
MKIVHMRFAKGCCCLALAALLCAPVHAQMGGMETGSQSQSPESMPSPPAAASVTVAGGTIDVKYNSPRMRGRKIMGGLVPYGQVWRTGANPATTLITSVPLKFGDLLVPAGTHTIYTLPSEGTWQLILNNQSGQWGTEYHQEQDLGRVPMKSKPLSQPQENMSITFENTSPNSIEMHVRWEKTDEYVTITKP